MNRNLEKVAKKTTALVNRKNPPPKSPSVAPEPDDPENEDVQVVYFSDDDEKAFEGLDWGRVPHLQKRERGHIRGTPSWIYAYGWPVFHRKKRQNYWLCRYCHQHKIQAGEYCVHQSTTSAAAHLKANTKGHGVDQNGKINFSLPQGQASILASMQHRGVDVPQQVANEIASSFSQKRFFDAVKNWIIADNQALRVIEIPSFRHMISTANPLAEQVLWNSHNTLRSHILAEYYSYVPAVIEHLKRARSLIHITFDNWTTSGGKRALTGICVHHLNEDGDVEDYLLGLPQLHGEHSGDNIASVVNSVLQNFRIDRERLGYFVLDNATNNDTAMESLGVEYDFFAPHRRLRCTCHILNLGAQRVIFGRDKDSFENLDSNLAVRAYRKYL